VASSTSFAPHAERAEQIRRAAPLGRRAPGDPREAPRPRSIDRLRAGALALAGLDGHAAQELGDEPGHRGRPQVGQPAEQRRFLELLEEKLADALEVDAVARKHECG